MSDAHRFYVDRTGILLFASALGETNPIYYDEEYASGTPLGGVIAPPTFAISSAHWNPEYPLRGVRRIPPAAPRPEGAAGAGLANLARVLHGEQRFDYHKPLRPGMELEVSMRPGKSWTKEGKRGGTLRFSEQISEFRDAAGELVLTSTSVVIVTEKAVEG
jgi:acyl dehydratase